MVFSIRIVNADLYSAPPLPGFDSIYSSFRESKVSKVPVIRIFGSTPNGQKTCLHVHRVFPYIYIPYDGSQPTDKYLKQFATSVDFAVHVSMGKASSSTKHVHDVVIVKARSFYGYHEEEREFMKICFYNPFIVSRVVDLLQNGAIMNKVFQPHESHIPYIQQMFIDYNLYGMNLLNASSVHFRNPVRLIQGGLETTNKERVLQSSNDTPNVPDQSPSIFSNQDATQDMFWTEENIPRNCVHPPEVERLSICELEVDVKAEDILNQNDIGSCVGTSPGLYAIWEEERGRRKNENVDVSLTPPVSQDRGDLPLLQAESYYKEKIREIIAESDLRHKERGEIPSPVLVERNHDIMIDNAPIVDENIVQEIVEFSQRSMSQDLDSSTDMDMVKMLASLAGEEDSLPSQLCMSPVASLSNRVLLSGEEEAEAEEIDKEEEESILMSQQVWDDTDPMQQLCGSDDKDIHVHPLDTTPMQWPLDGDDKDRLTPDTAQYINVSMGSPVRASQFDVEGLDESWEVSLLGEQQIPQLDGVNDDDLNIQTSTCSNITSRRTCNVSTRRLGMSSTRITTSSTSVQQNSTTNKKCEQNKQSSFSLHPSEASSSEGDETEITDQAKRDNEKVSENLDVKKAEKEKKNREQESKANKDGVLVSRPTRASMSYKAIKSVVFAQYNNKMKNTKRTELTKIKNIEKSLNFKDTADLRLECNRSSGISKALQSSLKKKGPHDKKQERNIYNLRNTKSCSLEIPDSTSLSNKSLDNPSSPVNTKMDAKLCEEQTSRYRMHGGSGDMDIESQQECMTNGGDLKVVVHDVAFSEKLRDLFVAAVNHQKRLEKSRPVKDLWSNFPGITSAGFVTRSGVPACHKPTMKRLTSPRKSPKTKHYGVLDVTVHTSPPKEVVSIETELPIRRNILSQLEHTRPFPVIHSQKNFNASLSFDINQSMDQPCSQESLQSAGERHRGVKRKGLKISLHKHAKKERLSLRLKRNPDCKYTELAKITKQDITTEDKERKAESIECSLTKDDIEPTPLRISYDKESNNEETLKQTSKQLPNNQYDNSPIITLDKSHDPGGLSQKITCIPSSPVEDDVMYLSQQTSHAPSQVQKSDDITDSKLSNSALFNMSYLSPRSSYSDTCNSPPSPFTPTLERCRSDGCKSITTRHSANFPFVNTTSEVCEDNYLHSYNSLPFGGIRDTSEPGDPNMICAMREHTSCHPQVEASQMQVELSRVPSIGSKPKQNKTPSIPSTNSSDVTVNRSGTTTSYIEERVLCRSSFVLDDRNKNEKELESLSNISCQQKTTPEMTFTTNTTDKETSAAKNIKMSCLNAIRQQCLLLENTKRALLGDVENEHILSHQNTTGSSEGGPTQNMEIDHSQHGLSISRENYNDQNVLKENSSCVSRDLSVIVPARNPPTVAELMESLEAHGIPKCRHQKPFYSNPDDVPETTMDVGGRLLKVQSKAVKNLLEFDTRSTVVGIRDWRQLLCAGHETSFLKACQDNMGLTEGFVIGIENNPQLKLAFLNDKLIAITPCNIPPSPSTVSSWVQMKMKIRKMLTQNEGETKAVAKEKINNIDFVKTNCGKQEEFPLQYNEKQGDIDMLLPSSASTHKTNSSTDQQEELTSLCSLFSPVEQKAKEPKKDEAWVLRETCQPKMNPCMNKQFEHKPDICELKKRFGIGLESGVCPSTPSAQSILSSPQHSTPIIPNKTINPSQLPVLTPIVRASDTTPRETVKRPIPVVAGTQTRRQLLPSQFKFVTPDAALRRCIEARSELEGPSPINTGGYKVPQMNILNNKPSHEVQHLTLVSIELHVRTRKNLRPDPEFDAICAIFYHAQTDSPRLAGEKNQVTGIICVDKELVAKTAPDKSDKNSHEASSSTTDNKLFNLLSLSKESLQRRQLLERSGVTKYVTQYVEEEKDLFQTFLQLIHKWDPDILIGYELQMLSWGYLIQRALVFELDLCKLLSRVSGSSSECNMDAENDKWGAAHSSELKIAGRIILNVWRLMRHEVALNTYTFENVAFHVLHERFPLFTYRSLSDWWDHKTDLHRWRTVRHYVNRCHGNIRILEHINFIGRTSELARIFGILFYCVISRGTQFRVESMMLRISKPMKYIAVSPSPQQRSNMHAPEVIPLVLEPESRFYSDPVLVLDFQSLYPSIIIAYNYCYSTCLGRVTHLSETGDFKFGATALSVPSTLLKKIEDDIHVSPNGVAFVKSTIRSGVLPKMLEEILNTRIMVKNSMKKWKSNKSVHRMLDARQLGLKLIANVTFGYTAANFSGRMPCVEIGDTIVRKARETLEYAIKLVNNTSKWGARVVYGDTDSMFVLLKGVNKEEAFRIGQEIVDTVTSLNPKPVKLKFEKVYLPCVLQTKKRYVGYMYETLDQKEPVFDAKGIETVRRDTCPAVAKVLEKSLRIMFETKDVSLVKRFVQRQFRKVMEGRVSLQDLTFAKEYRGMASYKPGACVPALELARRMLKEDRRSEPRVGERVPYVVTYGTPGLPLIRLVRRPLEVLQDSDLRINAMYYVTKQLIPPLNRAFSLLGVDVKSWFADVPRIARITAQPFATDAVDSRKKTISHYFSTTNCPVCHQITSTGLCETCFNEPQKVVATLNARLRNWERTYQNLTKLCYQCCQSSNPSLCCVSIDCPVFHKVVKSTRDLQPSPNLRQLLDGL